MKRLHQDAVVFLAGEPTPSSRAALAAFDELKSEYGPVRAIEAFMTVTLNALLQTVGPQRLRTMLRNTARQVPQSPYSGEC